MITYAENNDPLFSMLQIKDGQLSIVKVEPLSKVREKLCKKIAEMGINIQQDDYMLLQKEKFESLEKCFLCDQNGFVMSEAWFVERYIVGLERLEKIYSPYSMYITRELTPEEMEDCKLYDALHAIYGDDAERNISRQGDKDGLISRLKNVGFGLDAFSEQKEQKLRLIYLLYCFERDNNVLIGEFFKKPCAENRDDSYVSETTRNGELMHYLKSRIEKQLAPDVVSYINYKFGKLLNEWQQQFAKLLLKVDQFHEKNTQDDLGMTNNLVMHLFTEDALVEEDKCGPYKQNIISSFYLMLLEYESVGLERDLIDVAEWELDSEHQKADSNCLKLLKNDMVFKSEVQYYLDENKETFIKYIYNIVNATKNDIKRYRRLVGKIECFLQILYSNTAITDKHKIPAMLLAACLYEYVYIGNEKLENYFFRYQSSELRTLKAELSNGGDAFKKNQCAWISRAFYRYNILMERERAAYTAKHTTLMLQKKLLKVMRCHSLCDMIFIHNYYMTILNRYFLPDYIVENDIDKFNALVQKKAPDYEMVNRKELNTRFFFATIHNSPIVEQLADVMVHVIQKTEFNNESFCEKETIELEDNYYGGNDTYTVQFEADHINKLLFTWNFKQRFTPQEYQIFFDNGFYKMCGDR